MGLSCSQNVAPAWAAGAAVASLICAMHEVGAGLLNPAVTVAMAISRRCSLQRGLDSGPRIGLLCGFMKVRSRIASRFRAMSRIGTAYCALQLLAGVLAGVLTGAYDLKSDANSSPLEPAGDFTWVTIFALEASFTTILALLVLSMPLGFISGLSVGSCVTLGGLASAPVAGLLNPAVTWSLATAQVVQGRGTPLLLPHCLGFCLFQLAGGALAPCVYQLMPAPYVYQLIDEQPKKGRSFLD